MTQRKTVWNVKVHLKFVADIYVTCLSQNTTQVSSFLPCVSVMKDIMVIIICFWYTSLHRQTSHKSLACKHFVSVHFFTFLLMFSQLPGFYQRRSSRLMVSSCVIVYCAVFPKAVIYSSIKTSYNATHLHFPFHKNIQWQEEIFCWVFTLDSCGTIS